MMKRTIKQNINKTCLLVFSSLMLTGCMDLNYPNLDEYYQTFEEDVHILYTDEGGVAQNKTTTPLKDLFNDDSVNQMDANAKLDMEYYEYFTLKVNQNLVVSDYSIYFKTVVDVPLTLNIFVLDSNLYDFKVRGFNAPLVDEDGNPIEYEDAGLVVNSTTIVACKPNTWCSAYGSEWISGEAKVNTFEIKKDQYFVIQVVNNTGYGAIRELKPAKCTAINLMINQYRPEN